MEPKIRLDFRRSRLGRRRRRQRRDNSHQLSLHRRQRRRQVTSAFVQSASGFTQPASGFAQSMSGFAQSMSAASRTGIRFRSTRFIHGWREWVAECNRRLFFVNSRQVPVLRMSEVLTRVARVLT